MVVLGPNWPMHIILPGHIKISIACIELSTLVPHLANFDQSWRSYRQNKQTNIFWGKNPPTGPILLFTYYRLHIKILPLKENQPKFYAKEQGNKPAYKRKGKGKKKRARKTNRNRFAKPKSKFGLCSCELALGVEHQNSANSPKMLQNALIRRQTTKNTTRK